MIPGKSATNLAKIHWVQGKKEGIVPLHLVSKENSLWYCAVTFPREPIKFPTKYTHYLQEFTNVIPGKDQPEMVLTECKEQEKITVKNKFQFDFFIFPGNRHIYDEIQSAMIWYIQWLLKFVDDSSISSILTFIEGLNLPSIEEIYTTELVFWISKSALQNSTTDIQRFYLCIILSHLPNLTFQYLIGKRKACDRLLGCFSTCVGCKFLSKSDLERLKKIAITLVRNSSSPGWLTLAAYFYPYLGINFLLKNKHLEYLSHQYDSEKYQKLVTELLSCLKVDNQDNYQNLLKYVMKSAPKLVDALGLFKRSEISKMFAAEDEKVDFFVTFFNEEVIKSKKKMSLWERLVVFRHMPQKIQSKVYKWLYSMLLEYAWSYDKSEDIKVLVELILSIKQLGMDQFIDVLNEFSTSKSFSHQDLLLQILDDERFKEAWLEIPPDTTVEICKSWALNQVVTMKHKSKLDNTEMVVLVYQSMEAITQCCSLNTLMAQKVSAHVVERVFESKDGIYVLDAFESIEKLSSVVKECYISHVKNILTPELVKETSQISKEYSTRR